MPTIYRLLLTVCCSLGACAQTVTVTVGTGTVPNALVVNPVTNKIYTTNYFSSKMTVIDGATNSTTKMRLAR